MNAMPCVETTRSRTRIALRGLKRRDPGQDSAMTPFSILDLSPVTEGSDPAQSFRNSLSLARHGEKLGYRRYWLAEHHGMPGIASAATAVLLAHIGAGTSTIRIGAGGVMLPNHSPPVLAVPGRGLEVPVWILGSSTFGAQLAAHLGLPYAFASHFAPQQLMQAIRIYRETFKPSAQLSKPYVMLGFNVFAAETDEEAQFRASSWQQAFVNLRSGRPGRLPPPVKDYYASV